jgi:hypothetical protein
MLTIMEVMIPTIAKDKRSLRRIENLRGFDLAASDPSVLYFSPLSEIIFKTATILRA